MNNIGTIIKQSFIKTFEWNGMTFNQYLIQFNEYKGYHFINRSDEYEQALIGAVLMFDYSAQESKVKKYKVVKYVPMEELKALINQ